MYVNHNAVRTSNLKCNYILFQAIQFGVVIVRAGNSTVFEEIAQCTMKWVLLEHAFEISTLLFFVAPMTLITVLYVLIGIKLRRSRLMKRPSLSNAAERQNTKNQNHVIRMLGEYAFHYTHIKLIISWLFSSSSVTVICILCCYNLHFTVSRPIQRIFVHSSGFQAD